MFNLRPFQIVLLGGFAFLALVAIYMLRIYEPQLLDEGFFYGEQVVVWGSIDQQAFKNVQNIIQDRDREFNSIQYYYIDERVFDEELVNAIAEGRSPDLIILPAHALVKHRAKLFPIPYESLSERVFRDRYVDGAEIFALQDGVYGLPFLVDPLVMYWNRDIFASAGLAIPPTTWESVVNTVTPTLTVRDNNRNLIQSAIAFGEYRNVTNAKEILMMLAFQSGSRSVTETDRGYVVGINRAVETGGRPPLEAGVEFFTNFSNAGSPLYSWNRAQPNDQNAFVAEDLAMYFGLGSEAERISEKNPNLNFDVAEVPQGAAATAKRTAGDMYALAIPRAAYNPQGAFAAAQTIGSAENTQLFAQILGMSSPYRSVIAQGDNSPYRQVVQRSALITRTWLDPDEPASDTIFQQMIEDIVSNRERVSNAVSDAIRRLSFEY